MYELIRAHLITTLHTPSRGQYGISVKWGVVRRGMTRLQVERAVEQNPILTFRKIT